MVAPLSNTPGFTPSSQTPSAGAVDKPKETVQQTVGVGGNPPAVTSTANDLAAAAAVQPTESLNSPSSASLVQPQAHQVDFFSQLGNVLSGLIQPEDSSADNPSKEGQNANPEGNNNSQSDTGGNKEGDVGNDGDVNHSGIPELHGYKSVLNTKNPTDTSGNSVGDKDRAAIKRIESGSKEGNYRAIGRPTRSGDRAYGAYQVMGANIPSWTKKYYGRQLTIAQFLSNPDAQEQVFAGEFGRLKGKYGGAGAAQAWFAGEAGMKHKESRDVNGTSVSQYGALYSRYS